MKSKKKNIIITSIGIILLLIAIVGASYAYFQASIGSGSTTPVTVEAGTIDSLVFNTGNPITLEANQDNFASGQGNRSGSTTASAILTANNQASSAVTYTYNVYLNITENTYVKTGSSAELVLRVLDPNTGSLVSIPDLTQVTVGGVTGYDITEEDGLITIASNYSISTSTTKTDTWNISVYFVNLASDQSNNAGAYFEGVIQITREVYTATAFEDLCTQGQALNNCIVSTYTTDGANGLYYHSVGKTTSAEDGSYRYAGGEARDTNKYYYVPAAYNGGVDSKVYNLYKSSDVETVLGILYVNGLLYIDGYEMTIYASNNSYDLSNENDRTYAFAEILQLGYIDHYISVNPNNYVCFGTTNSYCDYDHLYRIIGVIPVTLSDGTTVQNLVKLIKADYASSSELGTNGDYSSDIPSATSSQEYKGSLSTINTYYWNKINSESLDDQYGHRGLWKYAELNVTNLNSYYLNTYLGNTWNSKIANVMWKVKGYAGDTFNYIVSKQIYTDEIETPYSSGTSNEYDYATAKVGLMYLSDYVYGNIDWESESSNYSLGLNNNWLHLGMAEWTITPNTSYSNYACVVSSSGTINYGWSDHDSKPVRPVFYLNNNVTYQSGSGTKIDPIRIN